MRKISLPKLGWFKTKIKNVRDKSFLLLENVFIRIFEITPKLELFDQKILSFAPRGGRGIRKSNYDSEFFLSFPQDFRSSHVKLHFNSRFWIFDSIKVIFLVKFTKKVNVILIQYIRGFHIFPSPRLLEFLKFSDVNIIKFWLDTWDENLWHKRILPASSIGGRNVLIDLPNNELTKLDKFGEYKWNPIPVINLPYVDFKARKNFLFYSGATSANGLYRERAEYISFLEENNFSMSGVSYDWKNPVKRPSYDQYRKTLSNSQIALNFTWKGKVDVTTGRTWEIFSSGVLLLQNKSDILNSMFEPNLHFLEFTSKSHLLNLLHELADDLERVEQISKAGMDRYNSLFDSSKFWREHLY